MPAADASRDSLCFVYSCFQTQTHVFLTRVNTTPTVLQKKTEVINANATRVTPAPCVIVSNLYRHVRYRNTNSFTQKRTLSVISIVCWMTCNKRFHNNSLNTLSIVHNCLKCQATYDTGTSKGVKNIQTSLS